MTRPAQLVAFLALFAVGAVVPVAVAQVPEPEPPPMTTVAPEPAAPPPANPLPDRAPVEAPEPQVRTTQQPRPVAPAQPPPAPVASTPSVITRPVQPVRRAVAAPVARPRARNVVAPVNVPARPRPRRALPEPTREPTRVPVARPARVPVASTTGGHEALGALVASVLAVVFLGAVAFGTVAATVSLRRWQLPAHAAKPKAARPARRRQSVPVAAPPRVAVAPPPEPPSAEGGRPVRHESCEIGWWRGYVKSTFYARTNGEPPRLLAESLPFPWRGADPPPKTPAAVAAHDDLIQRLLLEGWSIESHNGSWFATMLRRSSVIEEWELELAQR